MNVTTVHSLWLAPLCLLLGAALAWWLYRKAQGREGFSPRLGAFMAILRALAIASIAFFLLEPMVNMMVREVRKPVVVVLHDGSSSLTAAGDTASLKGAYREALERLPEELGDAYDIREFTYGEGVREGLHFDQQDALTDMGQALNEVYDRFSGPDLGAVIMDGDGITNRGRDPRLDAERLGVPIHTIALGDTTVRPDLLIRSVQHNRICFLGNEFPLIVRVDARHLKDVRTKVVVLHQGREVASQDLVVTADPFSHELAFSIKADRAGMQHYTVEVRGVDREFSQANNTQDVFIDVLDDRQKVLLLGASPHPDLGAIRLALLGLEGYEVDLDYATGFSKPVEAYDLIILHRLPSTKEGIVPLLERARAKAIPVLCILGSGMDMAALNNLRTGVRVTGARPAITDAQATLNTGFTYFTLDQETAKAIERFPPLQVPFGQYDLDRGAQALVMQRVGVVRTEAPLIAVLQQDGARMATIAGEGIWRWRIADQQRSGSTERADRLIHKLVQFLALKADKKRFRIDHAPLFTTSDAVVMNAEVYDPSYAPVPDAEVTINLKDEQGQEFPYAFRPAGDGYRLDAGRLPAGHYTWKANAQYKTERLAAQGEFIVRPIVLEATNLVADHGLLADLAARSGGTMVHPGDLDALVTAIKGERTIASRSMVQPRYTDLISVRWLFGVILLLLALEWSLRRWSGAY
ncbi:MAG: hypothetical protein IPP83_04010 [Flavobacteriales bacterium]|nr:hypothetical protein [Flavobacteriales bacterium]